MRVINRRAFLATVGASSVLAACGGDDTGDTGGAGNLGSGNPNGMKVPLAIDLTQADLPPGAPVFAYIVGGVKDPNVAGKLTQYHLDASGNPVAVSLGDNTVPAGTFPLPANSGMSAQDIATINGAYVLGQGQDSWANYGIPLVSGSINYIELDKIRTIPGLGTGLAALSGRIYLSVGYPIAPFVVGHDPDPASPPNQVKYTEPSMSGNPGRFCLFDFIEFSYSATGEFNGNTSQVDQFGLLLTLEADGASGETNQLQGAFLSSRPALLTAVANIDTQLGYSDKVFNNPVAVGAPTAFPGSPPNEALTLRLLSPKAAIPLVGSNTPLYQYFDQAIGALYASAPIVVTDPATGTYIGALDPQGNLLFTNNTPATGQPAQFIVGPGGGARIPSRDAWECANSLASGTDAEKNVQKIIAAALNRGVVSNQLDDQASCPLRSTVRPPQYYRAGTTFNPWSQLFHAQSANGLCYGFAYDDICQRSTTIAVQGTTSVTIGLGKIFS